LVGVVVVVGRARAEAEQLPLRTEVADAQALPYPDGLFDVVMSTFGAMFAPDQERTAAELLRVLRPAGRLGLANWTPQGFVGAMLRLITELRPLPSGIQPSTAWGTRERLEELLGAGTQTITIRERTYEFVFHSAAALFDLFADFFGPLTTLMQSLEPAQRSSVRKRWIALADELNTATDGTLCVPSTYLEVVAVKRS
jgi:SAM-dependent methyltransferase